MENSGYIWLAVVITLLSGTFSAVSTKVLYQLKTDGVCADNTFGKAYMFTLWMFIGEAMCLVAFYVGQYRENRAKAAMPPSDSSRPLLNESQDDAHPHASKQPPVWVYVILSCFDLSATAIGGVGLLYVNASTNQMLRGSAVLFTGLFSILILKRRLSGRQWGGICLVILGLALVGGASALQARLDEDAGKKSSDSTNSSPLQAVIGVILVLAGSALNSAQNVFEEKLLKAVGSAEINPLQLVGWEGTSGTILSAFLLLPVAEQIPGSDCSKAENTTDSLIQMHNRPVIGVVLLLYVRDAAMDIISSSFVHIFVSLALSNIYIIYIYLIISHLSHPSVLSYGLFPSSFLLIDFLFYCVHLHMHSALSCVYCVCVCHVCLCMFACVISRVYMWLSYVCVMYVLAQAVALALMNYYSQVISKHLSAVHRMLVSTLRTVLVWIVGLVIYYLISEDFGEEWVATSYMQLGGFFALIFGTFVYGIKPAAQKQPLYAVSADIDESGDLSPDPNNPKQVQL